MPSGKKRSLQQERAWLRTHAREYSGCWLAVLGEQLVAADRDLHRVLSVLQRAPGAADALLHYQP